MTKMKSKSGFNCDICNEVFDKKFDLLEHKNIHTGEKPFMCINCGKCFSLTQEYIDHIEKQHSSHTSKNMPDDNFTNSEDNCRETSERDFQENDSTDCCLCKINSKSIKKRKKTKSKIRTFVCQYCNKKFSTNELLSKHACFIAAAGESFQCSCSQTFSKVPDFKAHIGTKPYSCCSCSMQFNAVTNLIRHIRTHTKQKPYICKNCGRGFSQSTHLQNHSSIHLGVRAIKCNDCNFSCKTLSGLFKHKKKHHKGFLNQENYFDGRKHSTNSSTCPVCNKKFLFKRNMGMHMRIHSNKALLCTECGKVFETQGKLTSHYKACHRQPSVCKTCGKMFASAVLLRAHEKTHVSDKSFSCNVCQKTFTIKNYLINHMKTHSNKKQFSCSKCGKLFKVAVSLKYHSKICTSLNIMI